MVGLVGEMAGIDGVDGLESALGSVAPKGFNPAVCGVLEPVPVPVPASVPGSQLAMEAGSPPPFRLLLKILEDCEPDVP